MRVSVPCGRARKDTFLACVSGDPRGLGGSALDLAGLGTEDLGSLRSMFQDQEPSGHGLPRETEEDQEGDPSAQTGLPHCSHHISKISLAGANPVEVRSPAFRA